MITFSSKCLKGEMSYFKQSIFLQATIKYIYNLNPNSVTNPESKVHIIVLTLSECHVL